MPIDCNYKTGEVKVYGTQRLSDHRVKAKLQYTVNMRNPYFIDTVYYRGFSERTTRIMELGRTFFSQKLYNLLKSTPVWIGADYIRRKPFVHYVICITHIKPL